MNKKFTTLLAGMALLSVMSVNAQTTPSRVEPGNCIGSRMAFRRFEGGS